MEAGASAPVEPPVNIECDYLGKYIEQLMQKEHEGVTTKRLKDLGYGGHYGI